MTCKKCKKCKDKKCEYRNKGIEGFTIRCSEGCTKEIREDAISIMSNQNFINLRNETNLMNYNSQPAKLFENRLIEVVKIATNPLVETI